MTREQKLESALKRIMFNCTHVSNCEWTGKSDEEVQLSIVRICVEALKESDGELVWGDPDFKLEDRALVKMAEEVKDEEELPWKPGDWE